jgi:hypothetical protein
MIDVDGPNCGYYLGLLAVKPLQIEFVIEAPLIHKIWMARDCLGRSRLCNFQRTRKRAVERSHKVDVKEIKRLYREAYSLVGIRHTLRLSITLTRIMGIVKDRRRK